MKLKQSLLILSLVVMGVLFAACGGPATDTMVRLTVNKAGDGNGTVTSAPAGINLAADGTTANAQFNSGTTVTLTATPADGSTFAGFTGCTAGTGAEANSCIVTLNAATTVTATFNERDGGGGPNPVVNSVTVTPSTLPLQVGTTGQLTANVDATGGAAPTVTWASDAPAIADVDQNGVVTAKAEGTATITATSTADATKSGSATVTVTTQPPPAGVTSVTIDRETLSLGIGQSEDLEVDVETTGGADESVTWASDNEAVATVNQDGLVTGATVGQATITATSVADPSKSDTVQVTVSSGTTTPGQATAMVAAGTDDAEEYVNAFTSGGSSFAVGQVETTSSDLELTYENAGTGTQQVVGVRFVNLNIPENATITNAYIQFRAKPTADGNQAGDVTLTIAAQNSVNPPTFTESTAAAPNSNISARAKTQATVSWTPAPWTPRGAGSQTDLAAEQTPNLSTIVQELVGDAAWDPANNAIAFIITGTGTNLRRAQSYEGATGGSSPNPTAIPELVVDYTTPNP